MNSDEPKQLDVPSFAVHSTRGLIRDRKMRRALMVGCVVVALLLIVGGSTVFNSALNPHEHPVWFILYWIACGWVTILALLLAMFDLLVVRREARAQRENLERQYAAGGAVTRDDK